MVSQISWQMADRGATRRSCLHRVDRIGAKAVYPESDNYGSGVRSILDCCGIKKIRTAYRTPDGVFRVDDVGRNTPVASLTVADMANYRHHCLKTTNSRFNAHMRILKARKVKKLCRS